MPYLPIVDRQIESTFLKEHRVLIDDCVEHKLLGRIRGKKRPFVGSKVLGEVNGSNYVSLHYESESHMTAPSAPQLNSP